MEVACLEAKGVEGAAVAAGARSVTRVTWLDNASAATVVAKVETSAMIARVWSNTSRTGMESELGRER